MYINFADKAVIGLAAVPMMRDLDLNPEQWGIVVDMPPAARSLIAMGAAYRNRGRNCGGRAGAHTFARPVRGPRAVQPRRVSRQGAQWAPRAPHRA
jgi:hypothetical protein